MSDIIDEVKNDLVQVGEEAWSLVKSEWSGLETEIKADVTAIVKLALASAEAGDSIEVLETKVLNLLAAESLILVKDLTSGVLQSLIVLARLGISLV